MNVLMVTSSYPKFPGDVTAPFIESIAQRAWPRAATASTCVLPAPSRPAPPDRRARALLPVPLRARGRTGASGATRRAWSRTCACGRGVYLLAPLVALALRRALGPLLAGRRYDVVHAHWVVPNAALVDGHRRAPTACPWW